MKESSRDFRSLQPITITPRLLYDAMSRAPPSSYNGTSSSRLTTCVSIRFFTPDYVHDKL